MDLGEVVHGSRLLGIGQGILAAVVLDGDVSLLDVNVGSAVLTHGAQLHQVAVGKFLLDGIEDVEGAHYIVDLGHHRMFAANHREGSRALLAKVHNSLWLKAAHAGN
jgi:hypothetical protein